MTKCPTCGARYSASERLCPIDGSVLEQEQSHEEQFIGQVLHGKYKLESFISRGGMGAVFKGTHVMLGRPVAVKMIKPELVSSPEIVRRFQREARAATHLNHPNVVDVYDLGQTEDGTLYIAMELVKGQSLKEVIRAGGPMAPHRIVRILSAVCDGLAVAHGQGIVHRDLKPHNIMLTHDSHGNETPKIVDFGIAKTLEIDANTQLTADGSTIGTPHYMSPEQATGRDVDARSDLYSMGIILYEMLVGDVPFNDPSLPAVLIKHMTEAPAPPSVVRPDLAIPSALEAITLRCLAKAPAERYASAGELATALRMALPAEPPVDTAASTALPGGSAGDATIPIRRSGAIPPPPAGAAIPPPPAAVAAAATAGAGAKVDTTPGTRPTTPAAAPPPPIPQAIPVPPATSGRGPLVLATAAILLVVAAGGLYWAMSRPSVDQPEQTQASDATAPAPTTTPATGAPASDTPVVPAPPAAAPSAAVPPPAVATDAPRVADAPPPTRPATLSAPAAAATPPPSAQTAAPTSASAAARRPPPPTSQPPAPIVDTTARQPALPAAPAAPAPATPAPAATIPANPTVAFQCSGPGEVCGPLRSAMQEAMERDGVTMARNAADITLTAQVTVVDERSDQQFGTTFVVRTYSIEMDGDSPRFNAAVPMPPSRTFSADARVGGERLNENARLTATAAVERVRAFWKKRTP